MPVALLFFRGIQEVKKQQQKDKTKSKLQQQDLVFWYTFRTNLYKKVVFVTFKL